MAASTTRTRRRIGACVALMALAATVTACPPAPSPSPPYHPERLATGNRLLLTGSPGAGVVLANPGGMSEFPTEPAALAALQLDAFGYGNPGVGIPAADDRVGTVTHAGGADTVGLYDGEDNLRLDFGEYVTVRFSDDGTVMAVARFVTTRSIDVYDTDDLSLRRTVPWSGTWPVVHDISADNSTMLVRGTDPGAPSTDYPLYAYETNGSAAPQLVLAGTGGAHLPTSVAKFMIRFTDVGRVVFVADPIASGQPTELRSVAIDGSDGRTLRDGATITQVTGERGTGRVLVQEAVPGSTTQTQVVAVEDSGSSASTVVAGPLTDQSLSRVVLPA